jgi:hypothetical protein
MIEVSQRERNYILAGNYELLNAVIVAANREILLAEKKYDEMLERKNAEIASLKANSAICVNKEQQ